MKAPDDEKLIVGLETSDDAAVYKVTDDLAVIQTLDFFTPIVDDPYTFGRIAATNSLSDVYAMGGNPATAMNIVCFPNCLDPLVLAEILRGGQDKMIEAGCLLVGGHTVEDDEPKYGLSVMGFVHPDKVWMNSTAKPGDVLVLTKPIGAGVMNTALKGGMIEQSSTEFQTAMDCMQRLNKYAKEKLDGLTVHSATDITGFGLLGHVYEMAKGAGVTMHLHVENVPLLPESFGFAKMGLVPAGAYANREYAGHAVHCDGNVTVTDQDLLYDPQTSGGLLVSMPEDEAKIFFERMADEPFPAAIVGFVEDEGEHLIQVHRGSE